MVAMEHLAATNATLSPEADLLSLWHMPIYGQSQNNVLHIQHQCSSFPSISLILPEPSVSLLQGYSNINLKGPQRLFSMTQRSMYCRSGHMQ